MRQGAKAMNLDLFVFLPMIGFALWTVLAHVIGFVFEGNFYNLSQWAPWILLAAYPLYRWTQYPGSRHALPQPSPPLTGSVDWYHLGVAVSLIALFEYSFSYFPNNRLYLFWGGAIFFLGREWLASCRDDGVPVLAPQSITKRDAFFLFILTLLVTGIILNIVRPDSDDQYYSNLSVMTVDNPHRPLLSWNNLVWTAEPSRWTPVDRVPTWELLVAWVASLLNLEPITVSHLVLGPMCAAWVVLVQGALLRHLVPRDWLSVLPVVIFLLFALGGEIRGSHSVLSFVQIHFGKAVLVSAVLPLLLLLGLRFSMTGDRCNWVLMLLGGIAATGASSSGLFLAPLTIGVGLLANWQPTLPFTKRVLLGLLASSYPLFLGVSLQYSMIQFMTSIAWSAYSLEDNFRRVFGNGPHMWLYLFGSIGSWTLVTDRRVRRTLLGLSIVIVAILLNPWVQPIFVSYLTGPTTTWRINLIIPLPILGALVIVYFSGLIARNVHAIPPLHSFLLVSVLLPLMFVRSWRTFWSTPFALALVIFLLLMMDPWLGRIKQKAIYVVAMISFLASAAHLFMGEMRRMAAISAPRTHWEWAALKVPADVLPLARRVVDLAPDNRSALLPAEMAPWVPVFRNHPRLTTNSIDYLQQIERYLEPEGVQRRTMLYQYISGRERPGVDVQKFMSDSIRLYQIGIIVVTPGNPWREEIENILRTLHWKKNEEQGHSFWVQPS